MIRKIINIDSEKCNGCGLCASACHEEAIIMENGKARLLRDDYCDGLGDCLPVCPTGAISFIEREAADYDENAVLKNKNQNEKAPLSCSCPGSQSHQLRHNTAPAESSSTVNTDSQLRQWPVQIKLAPVQAPYFDEAHLLIAADCAAYSYGSFHHDFIKGRITLIGCPKLDEGDYTEKLTEIMTQNNIKSLMIIRMEVPCCGGIEQAAVTALKNSGKFIPWQVVTISTNGQILN